MEDVEITDQNKIKGPWLLNLLIHFSAYHPQATGQAIKNNYINVFGKDLHQKLSNFSAKFIFRQTLRTKLLIIIIKETRPNLKK